MPSLDSAPTELTLLDGKFPNSQGNLPLESRDRNLSALQPLSKQTTLAIACSPNL
ncbi:MAG: hypothetical protein RMY28_010065 [Nostoc sp. ChiSLP01]|nr:hypothetical protein [Nostoc sp. CmiSLP01]MDZ8285100.1 hypothetical protein [Nostoc sp. ChiSLP01]